MTIINHHLNLLVLATDVQRAGGAMLPWETPVGLVEARRRFGEDEDEEFEDYDFDGDEEEGDEEDEDLEGLDEDEEDYDDLEEDFDDDGEPRSPKRRKDWE